MQIGDGGYHAQMSLLAKDEDKKTSSAVFDFVFGYGNLSMAMTEEEIEQVIVNFAEAARRAREAGCDGIEIAAHKGYLIHQFLNPGVNRRTDRWGGSVDKRFRLLREIVIAIRKAVGEDYLLGVRMAAADYNYLPLNIRLPVVFPLRHYVMGNGLEETLHYGRELRALGVDYLHITSGFGFVHPRDSTGDWPVDEFASSSTPSATSAARRGARDHPQRPAALPGQGDGRPRLALPAGRQRRLCPRLS